MKLQKLLCFLFPIALSTASGAIAAPVLCAATGGAHGCYGSIQSAIDAAAVGSQIDVYPGVYDEVAVDRSVVGLTGVFQFGLYIDKDGLTLRGVTHDGTLITDPLQAMALIRTHATNAFGPSGIFVQGDGVTLSGLRIGSNDVDGTRTLNKTIEVIGDGFALEQSDIADIQGSVYINDFRYDATSAVSHVRAYRIEGNNFQDGVSIDLASGAGVSGPVFGRLIRDNTFVNSYRWPAISFNGSGTGIKWFTHPVGGAVIENNMFVNTFIAEDPEDLLRQGHIRVRGVYDESQFDWQTFVGNNRFDKAFLTQSKTSNSPREFAYAVEDPDHCTHGSCVFANRRIGALLEGEQMIMRSGDRTMEIAD